MSSKSLNARTPGEMASFAVKGSLLTDEAAELCSQELSQGLKFGTVLTKESIRSSKQAKTLTGRTLNTLKSWFGYGDKPSETPRESVASVTST